MGLFKGGTERKRLRKQRTAKKNALEKIDTLRKKVSKIASDSEEMTGIFFMTHAHSVEALSKRLAKMQSGVGSLKDMISHWAGFGAILQDDHEEISESLLKLEGEIRDLEIEIKHRKPTLWESFSGNFFTIIRTVASIFTFLKSGLLGFDSTVFLPDYSGD